MDSLYLNHLGMLNALGTEPGEILANALAGKNRLNPAPEFSPADPLLAGRITEELPEMPEGFPQYACRNSRLLYAALSQVREPLDDLFASTPAERIGVVLGSSTSGVHEGTEALTEAGRDGAFPVDFDLRKQEMGSVAAFCAQLLGAKGPAYTISTACSSSGKAIMAAARLIRSGTCDAVITGGCDTLGKLTLYGFSALEAISPGRTNPMSVNRDGINIGEGAAVFIMSRKPSRVAYLGGGECSDAYHISAPEPEGTGAEQSMRAALQDAQLEPGNISYINLHGTGTPHNDVMEAKAVSRIFPGSTPCSSTKPLTGHTLGAAGAVEAGLCWLCLDRDEGPVPLLPHCWDNQPDPEIPALKLVGPGDTASDARVCMLSNSFAFGGSNCTLILGQA